uniref:Uncharacterized protein n=1 Tax=Mustela putorius furo TaxID=9669 RepID=M3YYF8_MUSPF
VSAESPDCLQGGRARSGRHPSRRTGQGCPRGRRGGTGPAQRVAVQQGSRLLPPPPNPPPTSNLSCTNISGPPTRSQAICRSSVPGPRRVPAPLTQSGIPGLHSPSTIPAVGPVTSKDIVSNTLPPCHPNVHRWLPRLGRCIRTSCIGRPSESPERRGAIGYRRIGTVHILSPAAWMLTDKSCSTEKPFIGASKLEAPPVRCAPGFSRVQEKLCFEVSHAIQTSLEVSTEDSPRNGEKWPLKE